MLLSRTIKALSVVTAACLLCALGGVSAIGAREVSPTSSIDMELYLRSEAAAWKVLAHLNGKYPDSYGGLYVDDAGQLHINVVEGCSDELYRSLVGEDTQYNTVRYSLKRLQELQDVISKTTRQYGVVGSGVSELDNVVDVSIRTDRTKELLENLEKYVDRFYPEIGFEPDMIRFTIAGDDLARYEIRSQVLQIEE